MSSTINNQGIYMKKLLLAAAIATISSGAVAADNSNTYAGVQLGYANSSSSGQDTANNIVRQVGGVVSVSQSSGSALGRAFAGYQFNENISTEIGIYRTSSLKANFAGVTGGSVAYTGSINAYAWGGDASILIRPSVSTGLNGLFGRVGGHWDSIEYSGCSARCASSSESGTGFLAGAGYDASFDKNLLGRVEYTYYDSLAGGNSSANTGSVSLMYKF
jgi:Outer membrane protein beta-barrel domain